MEELVLDDVSVLCMGKQICADALVAEGEVEVNESLLTGEAEPILKKPGDLLLSGSFVVSGRCLAPGGTYRHGQLCDKNRAERQAI